MAGTAPGHGEMGGSGPFEQQGLGCTAEQRRRGAVDFIEMAGRHAREIGHGEAIHGAFRSEQRVEPSPELRIGGEGAAHPDASRKEHAAGVGERAGEQFRRHLHFGQGEQVEAGELSGETDLVLIEVGPAPAQRGKQRQRAAPVSRQAVLPQPQRRPSSAASRQWPISPNEPVGAKGSPSTA